MTEAALPKGWVLSTIADCVENGDVSYGIVQPGPDTVGGVPILRVNNLRGGRVDARGALHVAPDVSARHKRTVLRGGELLLSIVGTVGEMAVVPEECAGWNVARALAVLRPANGVSANWLKYSLTLSGAQQAINSTLNTTVQSTLNLRDVKSLAVVLPPMATRVGIEGVLNALDDKVQSNRRLANLSDALIRAAVVASSVDGAAEVSTSVLAKYVNGGAYTSGATGSGRMVVRIAELTGGPGASTIYNELDVPNERVARPGDLLMSWSGSLDVHRWVLDEAIINQHIFKVLPNALPAWLVFDRLKMVMPIFQSIARDKATTMGHIQRGHLESTKVPMPSGEAIARLQLALDPLWERVLLAEQESRKLVQLRDALLPELMSGRIGVREAEEAVAEVI